jgi:hypothetical protein
MPSIIFCVGFLREPRNGIGTSGDLSSGVILAPRLLNSSMLSLWVTSVPLVGPAYRSVRKLAVPPRNSAACARGVGRVHLSPQRLELGERDVARPALSGGLRLSSPFGPRTQA